jgi:hypothetical protein
MSVFQTLFAGKTWQLVLGGAAAETGRSAASPTAMMPIASSEIRATLPPIASSKTPWLSGGNHRRVTDS